MTEYRSVVEGRGGIIARVVADSISAHDLHSNNPSRIITFELEYPRFIHSEFMTHRMVSKNAASSRAIPVERNIEMIRARTAMPIHWGKNQPGMSAKEECFEIVKFKHDGVGYKMTREQTWEYARDLAIKMALGLHQAGYHKQIVNRILEPYTFMKVVATATEWDNLFWLRNHPDAQPEFQELARCMLEAAKLSEPKVLTMNDWHAPYFGEGCWVDGEDDNPLGEALKTSVSCCAQVSYRKNDPSLEKAESIYEKLVKSIPLHGSPLEHQARPFNRAIEKANMQAGKFTTDENDWWSGNFRNWFQFRQTVKNNVCNKYEPFRTLYSNEAD
jgi:hypothetical protein